MKISLKFDVFTTLLFTTLIAFCAFVSGQCARTVHECKENRELWVASHQQWEREAHRMQNGWRKDMMEQPAHEFYFDGGLGLDGLGHPCIEGRVVLRLFHQDRIDWIGSTMNPPMPQIKDVSPPK